MLQTITFQPDLLDSHCIIDARTPLEFAEDHLPGAHNVPLLTNEQRVEIGTLYKQKGPHLARIRGMELTAPRFPAIMHEIAGLAAGRPILVYCWRGGLRSKTVATIMELTGFPVKQLVGGYKAFRAVVSESFENFAPPGPLVVLHGMTGIGKTTLLDKLAARGESVIDLEGLARHRGSAFGSLGLSQDELTQKHFETLVWDAFRRLPPGRPVYIEGESRRIGRMTLPGNLYDVMQESFKVWCIASLETRVERLTEEYGLKVYEEGLRDSLLRIKKKLGGEKYAEIAGYLERWEMAPFMTELIVSYYDRLYYRVREWQEDMSLSLEDFPAAADLLVNEVDQRLSP
ncbi:MAG TPA: tRNA 2-selenouridine(34) synthase MnmH [Geobacteraceae bacterium]|nr:tRNA 2-selenouridine(34) synthase MnmH [Geobacteraceae bacterium]